MYDRKTFYDKVRSTFGPLTKDQVAGFEMILDEAVKRKLDDRWTAYIMATAWHETTRALHAVMESQRPDEKEISVDTAIARLESSWKKGRMPWVKRAYWRKDADGKSWLGRGLVQITHKDNYSKLSPIVNADLVGNPDRALELPIAVDIAFEGMIRGLFTGKSLETYFPVKLPGQASWASARAIINGNDRAETVAGYGRAFYAALRAARAAFKPPAPLIAGGGSSGGAGASGSWDIPAQPAPSPAVKQEPPPVTIAPPPAPVAPALGLWARLLDWIGWA